jgi:ribose-phosphate pyrophosphokinase
MNSQSKPLLFALNAGRVLGEQVAAALGWQLAPHEEREFEDGEHKARPLGSVRDHDVFVLHSLYGEPGASVNDKLCRLLFFVAALKDAGAARVSVIAPYLCYARKDRRSKPRDPVTSRYVACLFEAVGADCVATVDVHNLAAFQNGFRCRSEHLEARGLLVEHFFHQLGSADVTVVSPDEGGIKRAEAFRRALAYRLRRPVAGGFMEKQRSEGVVSGERIVGDFADRTVIIIDDLISSGTTLVRTARACRAQGARRVLAGASHGVFAARAASVLADPALEKVVVTNTVAPRLGAAAADKLVVLNIAPLLAEAICRLHEGGSLVELMELPE